MISPKVTIYMFSIITIFSNKNEADEMQTQNKQKRYTLPPKTVVTTSQGVCVYLGIQKGAEWLVDEKDSQGAT